MWRCGLVVDTWLRDHEVPSSSPGFLHAFSSSNSCVKRVKGVEKGLVVGMACRGPHVTRLEHFSWISAINALFNFILI